MSDVRRHGRDQTISADDVRRLMGLYRGTGWRPAMKDLAEIEPALAAYVRSTAEAVGMQLTVHNCSRLAVSETEQFVLYALMVAIDATRTAQRKLYDDLLPLDPEGP